MQCASQFMSLTKEIFFETSVVMREGQSSSFFPKSCFILNTTLAFDTGQPAYGAEQMACGAWCFRILFLLKMVVSEQGLCFILKLADKMGKHVFQCI